MHAIVSIDIYKHAFQRIMLVCKNHYEVKTYSYQLNFIVDRDALQFYPKQ